MIPGSNQLHSLATKYSKPQLQQMAQMGEISPLDAVMAGMMIDRIVLSANKPPESTVADDVFAPKTQMAGVAPGNGAQEAPGLAQAPQSAADISKAYGGLMSIPRPGEKYNQDNFATGGIVAFTKGGKAEDEAWEKYKAAHEKARGPKYGDKPIYDSQVPFFGSLPGIIGNPEIPHDAVSNPEAPVVAAPTSTVDVETQKQLDKVKPAAAPTGPRAAMVQKAAPASDEFAQKGLDALKLPKRTPADTTGLVDTPETIAKNKDDLMYRAVGYTGAEMMAGKSPFALVNIGEALSKGFSSYAQQIEAHKKTTKDDIKDLAAIKRAEQALEQNDLKMGVDIMTNELNNKSAMKRMEMQVKGSLEGARIGAGSKPLDIPHILMYGSPEEKERARGVVSMMNTGKDKTPQEVRIAASTLLGKNDEYAMLSTSDKPAERARAAKMLSDIEAYIRTGDMGGGGGKGEVNKSNPLLTGK